MVSGRSCRTGQLGVAAASTHGLRLSQLPCAITLRPQIASSPSPQLFCNPLSYHVDTSWFGRYQFLIALSIGSVLTVCSQQRITASLIPGSLFGIMEANIPNELFVPILEHLGAGRDPTISRRDFYNISLSSRTLRQLSTPHLYHHIVTDEVRVLPLVRTVLGNVELARLVKKLDVMGWNPPYTGPKPRKLGFLHQSHVPLSIQHLLLGDSLEWHQKNELLLELLMASLQWVERLLIPFFYERYFSRWPQLPILFPYLQELICYNKTFTFQPPGFSAILLQTSQVKKFDIRTERIEFLRLPIMPTRFDHLRHVAITCATAKSEHLGGFLQCCADLEGFELRINNLQWNERNVPHVYVRSVLSALERFIPTLRVLKLHMNPADELVGTESFGLFEGLRELSVDLGMLSNSLSFDEGLIEIKEDWTRKLPPSLERLHVDQWKEWSVHLLDTLACQRPAHLPHLIEVTRGEELKDPSSPWSTNSDEFDYEIKTMAVRMTLFSEDGSW